MGLMVGIGNGYDSSNKIPRVHFQSFNVSTDFSREDILELGRKAPYYELPRSQSKSVVKSK